MRRMLPIVFLTLVVAFGTSAPARADDGVGVVVTGDAAIQPQLAAQVEDWLRTHDRTLLAAPLRPDALTSLLDCFVIEDLACAREIVEANAHAQHLVFANGEYGEATTAGARDLTITAYWFEYGKDALAVRRVCRACSDTALHKTLEDVMTSLGAAAQVHSPSAAPLPVSRTRARSALPYVVGGAGMALLVTGIALYATSEQDTGETFEYRDTKTGGVALTIVGAAAITAGAYLFMRTPTDRAPQFVVLPGGAYVGWGRTF